jgi:hypothetical protein
MAHFPEMVTEIVVNPADKLVMLTPSLMSVAPYSTEAFRSVDEAFEADPLAFLQSLEDSQHTLDSSTGAKIDYSLIPGKGNKVLIIEAPFSDSAPNSTAEEIYRYAFEDQDNPISKSKAAPNAWGQTTKSGVMAELLKAIDEEMTVVTIFSPLPSVPRNAYTSAEYKQIRQGDFTPAARIVEEVVADAQQYLHGMRSETQFDTYHLHGGSLGASTALGAAYGLLGRDKHIQSVTAQELIVAPKNVVPDLAVRFRFKDPTGEVSTLELPHDTPTLPEPMIRRLIDRAGNEPMMIARMLQGMSKLSRLKGLTRPEDNQTPRIVEKLANAGVHIAIPLAETSGLTHDTPQYLPHAGEDVITVRATQGERTAHLIDEQVTLLCLAALMNIVRTPR